jgi:hypothetical protein
MLSHQNITKPGVFAIGKWPFNLDIFAAEVFLPSAATYPPDQHNNREITVSELSEN